MTQQKVWIGLIVLFLAGILTGSVGTALYWQFEQDHQADQGPAGRQDRIMKKLIHELSLDGAQQAAIKPIVEQTHKDLLRLRLRHQPEIEQLLAHSMANMKTTLSPDQQKKLDGLYGRLQQRWDRSRRYVAASDGSAQPPGVP
jgi:hypothetical protein